MMANSNKSKAENVTTGRTNENDDGPPFLRFCRWARPSVEKQFPHYLIAAFTFGLGVFACCAWIESRRGTQALEGQLKIMREAQRPWVGIDDENPAIQAGPVTFDDKATAHISYAIVSKNYSAHVANHVAPFASLVVSEEMADIKAMQRQNCKATYPPEFGQVLFPGKSKVALVSMSQYAKDQMTSHSPDGKVQIWMTGCILYDADTINPAPFSDFIFRLMEKIGGPPVRVIPAAGLAVNGQWQLYESSAH